MRIRVGLTLVPPTYINIFLRSKQFRSTSSAILPKIGNLNPTHPPPLSLRQRPGTPRYAPRFPTTHECFPTLDGCFPTTHECFPTLDGCFPTTHECFHALDGCFPTLDGCFPTLDGCFHTLDGCFPTLDGCLPKRTRTRGTRSFVVSVDLDMGYILQEILKIYKNFFYFFENFSKKKVLKKIIFLF